MSNQSSMVHDSFSRYFELILVLIASISIIGLSSALCDIFEAKIVVLLGMIVTLHYSIFIKANLIKSDNNFFGQNYYYIILLVLAGLVFRVTPFNYILGGQDQGVYVNIASNIQRTGSLSPIDPIINKMIGPHLDKYVSENYHSGYLPGVYDGRDASGKMYIQFQFYHLFPVWMAIFEGLFGGHNSVYALTLLSILSLLFCYQFVRVVTGNCFSGFIASFLLALNPLHSFFSKWPVTEVPTLLFSLAGFSCFAMYFFSDIEKEYCSARFIVLSTISFGCLFATRISGFMYLPSLFIIFISVVLHNQYKDRFNTMAYWMGSIFAIYAGSVWYGLIWSPVYSKDIYKISFSNLFGTHWRTGCLYLSIASFISFLLIYYSSKTKLLYNFFLKIFNYFHRNLGHLFVLVFIGGVYKVYRLAFSDDYIADQWIGHFWGLAGKGFFSVFSSSLMSTVIYVSPFLFFLFCYFMLVKFNNEVIGVAKFFMLTFFSYMSYLNFTIPYKPYYDRYLVSEIVPYMIIFVVLGWTLTENRCLKKIASTLLVITAIYSLGLTTLHIGKEEQHGAYDSLSRIINKIDDQDLLLLHGDNLWGRIKTPLIYKFGRNVASISTESIFDSNYLSFLSAIYDNIYVVSSTPIELTRLEYLGVWRVAFDMFDRKWSPASTISKVNYKFNFYKLAASTEGPCIRIYGLEMDSVSGTTGRSLGGKKISNGKPGFLVYGPYIELPPAKYRLVIFGAANRVKDGWTDVISGEVERTNHAILPLQSTGNKSGILSEGEVILTQSVKNLEVRVYVGSEDEVVLEGYELVPVTQ